MTTVACVGIAVLDMVFNVEDFPAREGKYYASRFSEIGGGVAANAAVAVARLGGTARFIGRVGADRFGDVIKADLDASGVDTGGIRQIEGVESPVSAVLVDDAGERVIVNYTPSSLFTGGNLEPAEQLDGADALLFDVRWPDGAARALKVAASSGIPSIFDFDRPMEKGGDSLLAGATHVVFSEPALVASSGTSDEAAALARIAERTDAWLAVTVGSRGVYWRENGKTEHLPAFDIPVVDTVGAGDVFHGALALAVGEGRAGIDAVRFAAAAAAVKCTRHGARNGAPTRQEVEELLEGMS